MRLNSSLLIAALVVFASPLALPIHALSASEIVDTIEQIFSVEGRPFISLKNVDGRTRIVAGTGNQVQVRAVKEVFRAGSKEEARRLAEEVEVRIEQVGNRIEIEAKYPRKWFSFGRGPRVLVHFEVMVPASSDVEARSVDGPLEAQGLDGRIELSTVDGDLTVNGCGGALTAKTVDGDISVEGAFGDVRVRTTDGNLELDGWPEVLEAKSTDGRIEIRVDPETVMDGEWSIRTTDGDIRLALPSGFGADLDIDTDDGRIRCDHPVSLQGSTDKNKLRGKLNDGGGMLQIRSSDGDVTIAKR